MVNALRSAVPLVVELQCRRAPPVTSLSESSLKASQPCIIRCPWSLDTYTGALGYLSGTEKLVLRRCGCGLPTTGLAPDRCCANSAQLRHSRPEYGLELSHFWVKVFKSFRAVPSLLGRCFPLAPCLHFATYQNKEQLIYRKVQRFRGGLVFKGHRLLYLSTLGLRVM